MSTPFEQLLALLASRGGTDLSSALADPYLSYIAGSYQPEPMKSEGDIYAEFAPTLMSIANTEPPGSWRQVAASSIASGVPAYRVKEDVLRIASENPDALGLTTSDEATKFVDELASENQRAQNELTKQAERQDPFQKAGYPGATQVYSPSDVVNMNPDLFSSIIGRKTPSELQTRLDAIREYGNRTITREQKPMAEVQQGLERPQGELSAFLYGGSPDSKIRGTAANVYYDPSQDRATTLTDAFKKAGYRGGKTYLGGLIVEKPISYLQGLASGLADIPWTIGEDIVDDFGTGQYGATREKRILEREAQKRTKTDAEGKPKRVLSKSATEALRRNASEAAKLVSRMKGGEEYNQRVAAALAEKISQGMQEYGRTPLSDALLRSAIVARQLRK